MKKLIFSVLAVAAMASCSKSELTERSNDGVAIMAKSEVLTVSSRTPFEGIDATTSLTARVIASKTSGVFDPANAANWHDDTMTFGETSNTTAVGFTNSRAYPADGSSVFLCGLYPASTTDWANFRTSSSANGSETTAEYVFDGKTDVMLAAQVETKKAEALANSFKKLTFNHMLTKLVVRAKANTKAAIEDFGGITDITLTKANGNNPYTTIVAKLNDGSADPDVANSNAFKTTTTSFAFYTVENDAATDTAFAGQNVALKEVDGVDVTVAPTIAYSLVAPIIADGTEDYELLVKTEENPDGFPVKINLKKADKAAFTGSTQGIAFVITLDFESTPIEALGEVTAWNEIIMEDDITIK